jgi:hypothetical protein
MRENTGLDQLYDIMRDPVSGLRNRLIAAIAASRVERLAMPGESEPEGVIFLREIVGTEREGSRFKVEYRREAASALSYWERRCKKAALSFDVADQDERREKWRRVLNGLIRHHLHRRHLWPQRKDVLFGPNDHFEMPGDDPDRALNAILLPPANRHERRKRTIDDPGRTPVIGSETERLSIIKPVAEAVLARLRKFDLAPKVQHVDGHKDGSDRVMSQNG